MTDLSTKVNSVKRLSPRERVFLLAYVRGETAIDAYLEARPGVDRAKARATACRMLRRIRQKSDWAQLLDEAGLGEWRLLQALNRALDATEEKFWKGESLGSFPDNATRMRATELLSELLGRRKQSLDLHIDEIKIVPAPRPPEERDEAPRVDPAERPALEAQP